MATDVEDFNRFEAEHPFAAELHDFAQRCQVVAGLVAKADEQHVAKLVANAAAATPKPRSAADHLLLIAFVERFTGAKISAEVASDKQSVPTVDLNLLKRMVQDVLSRAVAVRMAKARWRNPHIRRAFQQIEDRYSDPAFSESAAAGALRISRSYLGRLMMREVGQSFGCCLRRRRIERAQELLMSTTLQVSEIANACGYVLLTTFEHDFHRECQVSPREFRAQNRFGRN